MFDVLIVDQDQSIGSIFKFIFSKLPLSVKVLRSSKEYLRMLGEGASFSLVFIDSTIRVNSKVSLYEYISSKYPDQDMILLCQDRYVQYLDIAYKNGGRGVLFKPFDIEEVLSISKQILGTA